MGAGKNTRGKLLLLLFILLPAANSACQAPAQSPADWVLHSGKILTVDNDFAVAEALAVQSGRIQAVGSDDEILRFAGPQSRMIDLQGKTVIPGLIDSHSHPTSYGMHIFRPDLSKATSLREILALIAAEVEKRNPGEWITNSRIWNEEKLAEKRNPTRWDLDEVTPENPVFLSRGHLGVINSAAMKTLGIDRNTPDPPGGTIEREAESGRLTGRLYERALDQVRDALPEPTHEELMQAQKQSMKELAAAGVTSVRSAAAAPDAMRAFIDLNNRGELQLRTAVTIRINPNRPLDELQEFFDETPAASGLGGEMLQLWGVKMVADGGSDLAYLRKDYANRPGFRGQLGGSLENFTNAVKLCNRYGWRVGIHALGDAGIDFVLDAYEAADRERSIAGKRWSIEHGYLLQPDHFERIKRLGLVVHPQTWHFYNLRRNFVANYGEEYANMSHPYRTLLNHDIPIAGGTDWYLEPKDQFFYMWVAITRRTLDGEVVAADQQLTREEALRFHTIWAAYSTFEEEVKGSLEAGKFADLTVLSRDYMTVSEDEIKEITPLATMVGGRVVFDSSGFFVQ